MRGNAGKRRVEQVVQGSEMWGVLLVPSSSPTLSPIYDRHDVSVTSNVTWFHLNHDMVSRRSYKLSYGGHPITFSLPYSTLFLFSFAFNIGDRASGRARRRAVRGRKVGSTRRPHVRAACGRKPEGAGGLCFVWRAQIHIVLSHPTIGRGACSRFKELSELP